MRVACVPPARPAPLLLFVSACADCHFQTGVQKATLLWTNCPTLIAAYRDGAMECCAARPCLSLRLTGSHDEHVRGVSSKVSAAFPIGFAMDVARHINVEAARRLALREGV